MTSFRKYIPLNCNGSPKLLQIFIFRRKDGTLESYRVTLYPGQAKEEEYMNISARNLKARLMVKDMFYTADGQSAVRLIKQLERELGN